MDQRVGTYSRVIGWLKIILPLAALALLSTLFLLSRPSDPGQDIRFSDPALGDKASRQQVTEPVFSTVSAQGDLITLKARTARPEGDNLIVAEEVDVVLGLTDQSQIILNADRATVDQTDQTLNLTGGVRIVSSTGYELMTDALRTSFDRVAAESLAPVTGNGPAGRFQAGKLSILGSSEDGQARLLFTGGIKLVYDPQN